MIARADAFQSAGRIDRLYLSWVMKVLFGISAYLESADRTLAIDF